MQFGLGKIFLQWKVFFFGQIFTTAHFPFFLWEGVHSNINQKKLKVKLIFERFKKRKFINFSTKQRFKKCVDEAKEEMVKLGFPVFTMEDFYDNFVDQIDSVTSATEDGDDSKSKRFVNKFAIQSPAMPLKSVAAIRID